MLRALVVKRRIRRRRRGRVRWGKRVRVVVCIVFFLVFKGWCVLDCTGWVGLDGAGLG